MRFVCMQGLFKKEWSLLSLQITQLRQAPISVIHVKNVEGPHAVGVKKS